jgi:hypothetical protein
MEIEKRNHTKEKQGALREHCDVIKFNTWN